MNEIKTYLELLNEWREANEKNDVERMKELGKKILEFEKRTWGIVMDINSL